MPCGLLLVAAFSLVFVAACNKDDDDGNGNAVPKSNGRDCRAVCR